MSAAPGPPGPSTTPSTVSTEQEHEEQTPAPRRVISLSHPLFAAKARGLRSRIARFTPSWYSVTMGTGIVNTLLFNLPWPKSHPAFRAIGAGFLLLDIFLFICFTCISLARYWLFPRFFTAMLSNEVHSLFLGTVPMGFVTIVTGILRTGKEYGLDVLNPTLVLWWTALVMSMLTSFVVPYIMMTKHNHSAEALTAAWLLPVVPPITIAASGASFAHFLLLDDRPDYALTVVLASYVLGGIGLLIACGLMTIYFQRLAVHHLPGREVIVSTFLPLGPCGQGGYALVELGRVCMHLFPVLAAKHPENVALQELAPVGGFMFGTGIVSGLLLWGLGVWWSFLAVASVASHYWDRSITFNMGWWAYTFPLGSLTLLTFSLGSVFDSSFFNISAAIMTFSVLGLWTIVFVPTTIGFFRGTLFPAPCLTSLPPEYVEKLPLGPSKPRQAEAGIGPSGEPVPTPNQG